jgi:hypothetical protein
MYLAVALPDPESVTFAGERGIPVVLSARPRCRRRSRKLSKKSRFANGPQAIASVTFIQKPFSINELALKIREALES